MIVEDEKEPDIIEENLDLNVPPSSSTVQEPEFSPYQNVPLERALEKDTSIRDKSSHRRLKNDLSRIEVSFSKEIVAMLCLILELVQ